MIRLIQEKDLEKIVELFDDYRRGYRQEAEIEHAYDFLKERFDKQESIVFWQRKTIRFWVLLKFIRSNKVAQSVYQGLGMHREDDVYYFSKEF